MFLQIVEPIAPAVAVIAFVRHEIAVHNHMAVQMTDLLEALAADGAGIRTLVHVRGRDVRLQIRLPDERRLTHIALERPYVRMDRQVRLEHILVLEVLFAEMTLERSFVVVHLLVHRQMCQLLEHLCTDLALIRTTVLVRGANVTAQSIRQGIPFATDLAAVRTLVGVRQQVAVEIALLQEARATHVALIRLLAVVHVHVLLQRVRQAEAFRAHGALKATLTRVHQHMRLDVTGLLKPLAAYLTVVLAFLRVREYVPLQHALRREHFLAAVALEQPIDVAYLGRRRRRLTFVRERVLLQQIQRVELYAACCALERTIVVMGQRVLTEMAQLFEALVTHLAHIRSFIRVRPHVSLQHAREAELLLAICTL